MAALATPITTVTITPPPSDDRRYECTSCHAHSGDPHHCAICGSAELHPVGPHLRAV